VERGRQRQAELLVGGADPGPVRVVADHVRQAGIQAEPVAAEDDTVPGVADVRLDGRDVDRLPIGQRQPGHSHDGVDSYAADDEYIQVHAFHPYRD
jgi:hypothetical protein